MGHQRRIFPTNHVFFVTNRLAEGLPFVANLYINLMLFGILARARFKNPQITICGFIFLANHYHLLLVLRGDPNQLKNFMHYIDGEIAKLVTRWLGKRHVKIWAQRYHAPPVLTAADALNKLLYIFLNPVKANLVSFAHEFPGCSSFYSLGDKEWRSYRWFKPSHAEKLHNGRFTKKLVNALVSGLTALDRPSYLLPISPFAWMDCFAETQNASVEEMRKTLLAELARGERKCAGERRAANQEVVGAEALSEQNPFKPYRPKKFGRRMLCICACQELRFEFIALYKDLCRKADEAWASWKERFEDLRVPHGMYSPPRGPRGSVISLLGST